MGRTRGSYNFSQNFEVFRTAPLDARQKVQIYEDLVNPTTWEDSNGYVWLYKGAVVVVTEDPSSGLYWLTDAANYQIYDSWRRIVSSITGEGADGINIGDGSANVFAGNDASGNLQFRTFSGSSGTTVTQVGEQIIIGIDASYSGQANYGVNIGDGDASVYSGKVGDALQFRELKAGQNLSIDVSGNLIIIDASISGGGTPTYDTALDPSLAMPSTVGGIPSGTLVDDLKGDTLIKMWDDLLFPTAYPTLSAPSGSFSMGPVTTLYEVGSNATLTFTTTLNRGSISPQYTADSPYRSGLPNNFVFTGTGLVDASSSAIPYVHVPIDVSIVIGNQSWTAAIGYDGGVQPYDNKGNTYDSSLAAGSLSAFPTRTIEGVYPLYATTSDITTPSSQALKSMILEDNIVIPMVAETAVNKQTFDIPQAWESSRPLTDVYTYNPVSSQYESTGLGQWTQTTTTHTVQSNVINYNRYTYNSDQRDAINIRLKF